MMSVLSKIQQFNKGRLSEIVNLKYTALLESPFRFFRGTCHLFYQDLSLNMPIKDTTAIWICGDLHLENFGSFKGSNGLVYFDLNDFDEAILAPVTWELLRTLTSIYLAVDMLKEPKLVADKLAVCFLKKYTEIILKGKPLAFERATTKGLVSTFIETATKRKYKDLLSQKVEFKGDRAMLKSIEGKTIALHEGLKNELQKVFIVWTKKNKLSHWQFCDACFRVAGTGSLGIQRFVLLVKDDHAKKYLLLDMKQATPSSLLPFVPMAQPHWQNEAERVITIQNYMQNVTPALLDTITFKDHAFVLKKMQASQDIMDLNLCQGKIDRLENVITDFAGMTASAHLRAAGRKKSTSVDDLISFFKLTEKPTTKLLAYSKQYARQVKTDYQQYCKAFNNN
jgi:uncharacterized protein (DUF2252 family)